MDKGEAMYVASICSMIQELMRTRQQIDTRIDQLFDELSDNAWFGEYTHAPDDYRMD